MGGLSAATMLAGRGMQPLLGAIGIWCRLQSLAMARARVAELAQLPDERRGGAALLVPVGEIRLEQVRFRPLARGGHLFEGIDLTIAPGTLVGLCGVNGSGRSSLLQVMAGEEAPDGGRVLVDGQDLAMAAQDVAGRIALVPSGTALVQGTLLQNMTLHDAGAERRAMRLGRQLGLDAVAGGLPQGWHTPVGAGAHPLSRGIAARIGILRALLAEPRILLLDDVTADIDADGDARLRQLLTALKGGTTVVIATHRRSILALADRVLMLEQGRVREGV
jgi:ATP-binding cassette subfamily C protein LapB